MKKISKPGASIAPRPSRLRSLVVHARKIFAPRAFVSSGQYWEGRYADGGHSGAGSYGRLAAFKADVINQLIKDNGYRAVIEFGCGDGAQQELFVPIDYTGIDVSRTVIERCQGIYGQTSGSGSTHQYRTEFMTLDDFEVMLSAKAAKGVENYSGLSDLALSLDVIYHLVEDDIFDAYMHRLFTHAGKCVVIYASNEDSATANAHVRHRKFSDWISANRPDWEAVDYIANPYPYDPKDKNSSFADFHIYKPVNVEAH